MAPIPSASRAASECIILNELEKKIFDLLKECCEENKLDVTLRVAGGWVRDKLLGLENHDCDIAIDRMMGQHFAERLRSFLERRGIHSGSYGVIQANPERSKHLETATLTVYGHPIDFANLRSETYSNESRIPTVQFGTPLQDAQRRDITINALFYNIQTEEVEDFCGSGFIDLEAGIIRTPLPAKETLLDDPLRLLRVVRFATRFQFSIDPELEVALMDEEVDASFRYKISRERVGTELDKILRDKHALEGLQMMHRLGIFNLVFDIPHNADRARFSLPSDAQIKTILSVYERIAGNPPLIEGYNKRLALLAASLLPHARQMMERPRRATTEPLVNAIIRDSIKFTNQDMLDVWQLLSQLDQVQVLVEKGVAASRTEMGRIVRSLGRRWDIGIELACIDSVLRGTHDDSSETVLRYLDASKRIIAAGLQDSWSYRTILSGRDLQELLNLKQSPKIGILLNILLDWQYEHPKGAKQDAVDYILSINGQIEDS